MDNWMDLAVVITSLALAGTRSTLEIFPHNWREQWEHLELMILVLMSLTFQIMLIALGSRRKTIRQPWIRIVVWCVYLSADAVAILSVGVIRLEPALKSRSSRGSNNAIDPTTELRAFWAPFLLMHLGGPDTITAYALEDNELWLRHCLTLVTQAVVTLYTLFLSWSGSYISWLYVVIFICGFIKYAERVWALWSRSNETFQDKTLERHQRIPRMLEERLLKEVEGHVVVAHLVKGQQKVLDDDASVNWQHEELRLSRTELNNRRQGELLIARGLVDIFLPAFTDMPLSVDDSHISRSILEGKHSETVFNIIAIELGFIYDLLYTKAMLFQSPWGVASRVVTLSLTAITLGVFTFISVSVYGNNASTYAKTDFCITLALVAAAFFLELYALFHHLFSDRVIYWLIKHKHTSIVRWLLPLRKQKRRWSGKIGRFSLVSYSLKEKHHLSRHEIRGFQRYFYLSHQIMYNELMDCLYDHIRKIPSPIYKDLQSMWDVKWGNDARREQLKLFHWAVPKELEFDMCILIWHIATDICYHAFHDFSTTIDDATIIINSSISLDLSQYMLYLLVIYPSLLPPGIGRIRFKDMHSTMTTFFENHRLTKPQEPGKHTYAKTDLKQKLSYKGACNLLRNQVVTQLNLTVSSGDKSKFVMFYGCKLASQLIEEIKQPTLQFELLRETWIGLLVLVALDCKTSYHLQHLRRGGELLTHVWLLLVHFGLTDHFKIPHTVEIAEMIIKKFD